MKKELVCKHYEGEGYDYNLIGSVLLICKRCERKLRKGVFEQDRIEGRLKTFKKEHDMWGRASEEDWAKFDKEIKKQRAR